MVNPLRLIFCLLLCSLFTEELLAQSRWANPTSSYRGRYKNIKVNRSKAKVVCPVFEDSQFPYHGIGIKVGDPFALTYKYYASNKFGFALDVGKTASGLYSKYYRENFEGLTQSDTLGTEQGVDYLGHVVNEDYAIEGKFLYQQDASKLLNGLHWYAGGGIQWRRTNLQYEYLVEASFDNIEIAVINDFYTTLGAVAVFGIEYAYFNLPIAAFMEIEWYTDVIRDVGWSRFQGGAGLRLVF